MAPLSIFARACVTVALASSYALAQSQQSTLPQTPDSIQRRPRGGPGGPGGPGDSDPSQAGPGPRQQGEDTRSIDEVVKDFTKMDGVVTLYRQRKGANDTIYMEIPDSLMNKLLLLQITAGSGLGDTPDAMVFHGMPLDDVPVRIRKVDDSRIEFVRPNLAHRSAVPEVKKMISRSFPDEVIASFDIRSRQADRHSYLIDVGSFFKSDVEEISTNVTAGGYSIDPAHTYIDTVKNFPENAVVHTMLSLVRRGPATPGGPSPKAVPWAISYNLSIVPESNGYKPRLGDSRVGYFTQTYQSLDDQSSRDQVVNFIERWDLKKQDPTAKLSLPVKPIVFYIDNAVPREFRDDVRRGLLMWNPAFERIGIKDALVVKQMPDDADWDIADLRYNVVRWTTGMPFAIALMRANPLTGQILNASINFDGVFASGAAGEYDEIVTPTALYSPEKIALPGKFADMLCDMQQSSAQIGAEGENLFELTQTPDAPFDRKAYVHQRLAEVVCHEMGHCLGLRHNFIASTQLSLKQLGDPDYVKEHGTSASVMDYVPYNIAAIKKKGVDYYQTTVGDYDRWAVSYGYTETSPSATTFGEKPALEAIASKDDLPGHRYLSDYTADDYDPADVRYDFSSEPLDWAAKLMDIERYLLTTASARKVKSGDSYYSFTRSWVGALNGYLRAASYVPRYVGGDNLNNAYKGDPDGGMPIQPVPAAEQRKALKVLDTYVFGENSFKFRKEDLERLTFNPNVRQNEAAGQARLFPIRSTVSSFQSATLHQIFQPAVLNRIANNEFRDSSTFSLAELFGQVTSSVWSELSTGDEISDLRRQLQREDLTILINFVVHPDGVTPDDARALALSHLKSLKSRIVEAEGSAKGPYGKAHLGDCKALIDQALAAQVQVTEAAPAPAGPGRRGG